MEKRFEIHPKKFEITNIGYDESTPVSLVAPIEIGGVAVESKGDLKKVVEAPLLKACELLFEKRIQSIFSSANQKDIESGIAYIAIDFESLSEHNKRIALEIGHKGTIHGFRQREGVYLEIPITERSTVGEISGQALALVSRFENQ